MNEREFTKFHSSMFYPIFSVNYKWISIKSILHVLCFSLARQCASRNFALRSASDGSYDAFPEHDEKTARASRRRRRWRRLGKHFIFHSFPPGLPDPRRRSPKSCHSESDETRAPPRVFHRCQIAPKTHPFPRMFPLEMRTLRQHRRVCSTFTCRNGTPYA